MQTNRFGFIMNSGARTQSTCMDVDLSLGTGVLADCPALKEEIRLKPGYHLVTGSIATPESALRYLLNG